MFACLLGWHHPWHSQVFGICCPCTGRAALVMELVKSASGGSLDLTRWAMIHSADRSLETHRHRISIASGVAAGMAFLHDRGYIHADLKPGNVRTW
jgi:serine/threonine protein kinase